MMHAIRKVRAAVLCAAMFALIASAVPALAGQPRTASSPIPGRVLKVKEGDWVLVRTGDELIKETATKIIDMKPDGKPGDESYFDPIYMVEYKMEKFDAETGRPVDQPLDVVRALEHEIEENAELVRSASGKPQRRKMKIDGKNVNIVIIPQKEEGVTIEHWFTDEFGIDGKAGLVIRMPDNNETYNAMEVVGFGSARQPMSIQKYLQKKSQ